MSGESYRKWKEKNPEKAKKRWSEWVEKNPERARKRYKEWYYKHHEEAKEKKRMLMRKYRAEDPEKYRKQTRDAQQRKRKRIFEIYGDVCSLCGFTDKRALTIDHVKKNGAEERKKLGERGVYRRAIEKHRPQEYRILCMNCQFIERQR